MAKCVLCSSDNEASTSAQLDLSSESEVIHHGYNEEMMAGPVDAAIDVPDLPAAALNDDEPDPVPLPQMTSTGKKLTRKRKADPKNWKRNKAVDNRSHGIQYVSRKGQLMAARAVDVNKNCAINCKFKCIQSVSNVEQEKLCQAFWKLGQTAQQHYYKRTIKTSKANGRDRSTYTGKKSTSRSFHVELERGTIRVCKIFYQSTHAISHSQINTFIKRLNEDGNPGKRPIHSPPNKTSEDQLNLVRNHINSFPRIESHYCRSTTKKEYLEAKLSKTKMYKLYKEMVVGENGAKPVSEYVYGTVFDYEYNIGFHAPKKDVCDKCSEYEAKVKAGVVTFAEEEKQTAHVDSKKKTREQRHKDTACEDPKVLVVSFDLENVFALPRTNVSSAFYKRKLNVYNMTARVSRTKKAYCGIWNEAVCGRAGNDMASVITHLVSVILADHPEAEQLILWSDSCIPQNRNQMMSVALQRVVQESQTLVKITQRYCEPGHSAIQDVDNLHSIIERALEDIEIFSPLSLVRHLCQIKPAGVEMYVRCLQIKDFFQFSDLTAGGHYKNVRYSEAKELTYFKADPFSITVRKGFNEPANEVSVLKRHTKRDGVVKPIMVPKNTKRNEGVSQLKFADIQSLLKYMTGTDRVYMSGVKALPN